MEHAAGPSELRPPGRAARRRLGPDRHAPRLFGPGCDTLSVAPSTLSSFLDWLQARGTPVKTVHEVIGGALAPPVNGPHRRSTMASSRTATSRRPHRTPARPSRNAGRSAGPARRRRPARARRAPTPARGRTESTQVRFPRARTRSSTRSRISARAHPRLRLARSTRSRRGTRRTRRRASLPTTGRARAAGSGGRSRRRICPLPRATRRRPGRSRLSPPAPPRSRSRCRSALWAS